MDVEQLIEKLGRPLSSYTRAAWVRGDERFPARIVLFPLTASLSMESVVAPDGLTDADGMALAKDFNEFLRTMNRLKGARNE